MRENWQLLLKRWKVLQILALAFVFVGEATALSYSATPIRVQVIDAETREPISDVIALVVWTLEDARGGSGPVFKSAEAVSDARGEFTFPGWGPLEVPRSPDGLQWRLDTEQPVIFLFKPGFVFESVANEWESWMLGDSSWTGDRVRRSVWDSKQILLPRFHGTDELDINRLSIVAGRLPLQACQWAKIPRLTAALVSEGKRLSIPKQFNSLPTIQNLSEKAAREPQCPSPIIVLGPFLK